MNHPDILAAAASFKTLAEKVSKNLPFLCKVELHCNLQDEPEVIINDWVVVTLVFKDANSFGTHEKICYNIGHIHSYPATRNEPEDSELIEDISFIESPWKALKEAFKLLVINDLDQAIQSVNEDEMVKEEREAEAMMAVEDQRSEVAKAHRDLLDPL